MARRTAEQLHAEIDRADELLRIFEDYRRVHFSKEEKTDGPDRRLPGKEEWVSGLREQGVALSQILHGYEQALNGFLVCFSMSGPDVESFGNGLRAYFRERTGKDLFSVVTPPTRKLKAIAKRGRVKDDTEFYLVKECVDGLSDDPRNADLAKKLFDCLSEYEFGDKS